MIDVVKLMHTPDKIMNGMDGQLMKETRVNRYLQLHSNNQASKIQEFNRLEYTELVNLTN